jgi:hypothetical protein
MSLPPGVYRAPMRSRVHEAPAGAGATWGVRHGVVGIGERLPTVPDSLAEAVSMTSCVHGERAGRALLRFARVPVGAFVWTRELDGALRLGQIAGEWRYVESAGAAAVGIHHVRPCTWSGESFTTETAPAAVVATLRRGGRNFQRIHDDRVGISSARCFARRPSPA